MLGADGPLGFCGFRRFAELGPEPQMLYALWEHEVVELMLLGDDERYLEIELGPHGHYLVLQLQGPRRIVHQGLLMHYATERRGDRWIGEARVPVCWIPPHCGRLIAFAIHGAGAARRHLAWRPAPGTHPDFHRLDAFGVLADCHVAATDG